MAKTETFKVTIKEKCKSYKEPNKKNPKFDLNKGDDYTNCAKIINKDKNGKVTGTWYKLGNLNYVQAKYCKVSSNNETTKPKNGKNNTKTGNKKEKLKNAKGLDKQIKNMVNNKQKQLESKIDGSVRMFGLPHQLTAATDHRLSNATNLGTMFTEIFVLEAPIIYIKPGTSNFLPNMSKKEKKNMTSAIVKSAYGEGKEVVKKLQNMKDKDYRYFEFKEDCVKYYKHVNMLCRFGAVMLQIADEKVRWVTGHKNMTLGNYDWADYRFSALYSMKKGVKVTKTGKGTKDWKSFAKKLLNKVLADDNYIAFYVDGNTSASESSSNSTGDSVLNQFTDSVSSVGKELSFVSGVTGLNIDEAARGSASAVDDVVSKLANGDSSLATFLKRLTGTSNQLLRGDSFLVPEIYTDSSYSKSYSFSITLATPYGCKEAWYLNVYVPLMHLLVLALPVQTTANTYAAPFLVRAYSKGWFSCDLGIIDSISIDKGGSGNSWTADGMAGEIKVSVTIKDLYAMLALPSAYNFKAFFSNTGLINYLMINCGIDITKQSMDEKVKIMVLLFKNIWHETIIEPVETKVQGFFEQLRNSVNLFQ